MSRWASWACCGLGARARWRRCTRLGGPSPTRTLEYDPKTLSMASRLASWECYGSGHGAVAPLHVLGMPFTEADL